MKKSFLIIFLILLVLTSREIYAGELSNIDLIDSLVISSISEHFDDLRTESTDSLAIDVSGLDWEKSNYLKIFIGNLATKKSFKVFRNYNATSSFEGLVLAINKFSTSIEYSKPFEKSFLGKNYVTRKIETEISGQFYLAKTEEVKKVIDKRTHYKDDIPYGIISEIENVNYGFSKGKREDYSFWEKIYEPVLVVVAVGVVVYLFFTQRT